MLPRMVMHDMFRPPGTPGEPMAITQASTAKSNMLYMFGKLPNIM